MKKSFKILLFCALIGSLLLTISCSKEEEIYIDYPIVDGEENEYITEEEIEENDCILKDLPGHNDIEGYHVIQGVTEEEFHKILEEHDMAAISDGMVGNGISFIAYTDEDVYTNEYILVYFYNEENPLLDKEEVNINNYVDENIEDNIDNNTEVNTDNYIDENIENYNNEEFTDEDDMMIDDSVVFEEDY